MLDQVVVVVVNNKNDNDDDDDNNNNNNAIIILMTDSEYQKQFINKLNKFSTYLQNLVKMRTI
jgi:hypothetical protein